ncbi:MAG: hypothetical protein HKN92_07465 [Chitinophagales bacterium]|nr:hypothetical protein [Chitinophagales bacterium]
MAKDKQKVKVGKRTLDISNLQKDLYPADHILKAEVISYYLRMAPTILKYIKGRPLTMIRFPDGIDEPPFYQKNKPAFTPEWIESVSYGSEKVKEYIVAKEAATLVWLANLACLELHALHAHLPNLDKPDYLVFDLDPPEKFKFQTIIDIALELKLLLEGMGYNPFVKTSGGKGLHIFCPIENNYTYAETSVASEEIAKKLVNQNSLCTLKISKNARTDKLFVDIYRLRKSQTTVAPYSLRGKPGAPVSMPLSWEMLRSTQKPTDWNIHTSLEHVMNTGDEWEGIGAYAAELHTHRKAKVIAKKLPKAKKYKTPDQLEEYKKKRDFKKTKEPKPNKRDNPKDTFVIHRHHASRLHYDLRLEMDGVLKSWAVPRGMPQRPGIKRLAVQTEDHPIEYLNFDGTIPKGEYGAGRMWIYASGRFEITKEKKNGFYFMLHSPDLQGEFRMHLMKDKEWLLERVDESQVDWLNVYIKPMLASSRRALPVDTDNYIYEVKWDGIRAIIQIDEGEIRITSRNGMDLTTKFPELLVPEAFYATNAVFDGEIVCLDTEGRPVFSNVIKRMQQRNERSIERMMKSKPVYCYLFDCIFLDGKNTSAETLIRRREYLKDAIKKETNYRYSQDIEDGKALFDAAGSMGLEGIMAKQKNSKYRISKRNDAWVKIKHREVQQCVIIGYTVGKGSRETVFGSLEIAEISDGKLIYRGKVGSGFDEKKLKKLHLKFSEEDIIPKPIKNKVELEKNTVWIEPKYFCDVEYASITKDGQYREPVFKRMRPDLEM